MTQAKILDESDAVLRAELSRLETERKHITASLDQRITQIRSIMNIRDTLPPFDPPAAIPSATPMTRAPAHAPTNGARPRGEIQVKIYEHIMAHPKSGYREIVESVYGEYSELHYNSTRNAIAAMKKNGWLSGERGKWAIEKGGDA